MHFTSNRKARLVIYNLAFLLLFTGLAEIILRITGFGYDHAAFEPDTILHHIHKKNYRFINNNPSEKEYSNIAVHYDEEGCVSNPTGKNTNSSGKKIALIGDSYMEGLQVPFDKSITGILQKQAGHEYWIKNFAVGGYSPVIYYLQLQQVLPTFHPDLVIMVLYSNDVREDQEYLQQATYSSRKLIGIYGGINPFKYHIIRSSYLLRLIRKLYIQVVYNWAHESTNVTYKFPDSVEEIPILAPPTTYFLDSIAQLCSKNNCELILSAIPSRYRITNRLKSDSSDFSEQCRKWAQQREIKYIDLVETFENGYSQTQHSPFFKKDIHLNADGHNLAAQSILNFLYSR